jgi:hypothetical protein
MSGRNPSTLLTTGLLLGLAGNLLLRVETAPALNMFLWSVCVAFAAVYLLRATGRTLDTEARLLLATAVLLTAGLVWRDAEALKVLAIGSAIVAFALPAWRAGTAWLRRTSVWEAAAAVATGGAHGGLGPLPLLRPSLWAPAPGSVARPRSPGVRNAGAALRGVLLATPFVVVFGALFTSADAIFAGILADVVQFDLDELASHIALTLVLGWIATGYLQGFTAGTRPDRLVEAARPARILGRVELMVALGLVQLLFLVFVAVQFRYLFGGSGLVEVTAGLTYAEYARRGFFELVFVTLFVLPMLLAADSLRRRDDRRDDVVFRVLAGTQIVLVLAVMVSAVQRLRLYVDAYGLTEQRFYAAALLVLLSLWLVWFAVTVLRGRAERFALGVIIMAFLGVAALHAMNPDAFIARTNVAHALRGDDVEATFDAAYVASLSADAVPVLLAALPSLAPEQRCVIAARMLDRWPPASAQPLRSWNASVSRARALIRERETVLRSGC